MATSKNNKTFTWNVREIEIERGSHYSAVPSVIAHLDILGTPFSTASMTELAVDLQNRLSGKTTTIPEIKKVIFNPPATIVLWSDNTKTVVKCQDGDEYDPEHGLAMAIVKKMYGNTCKYCKIFKKWIKEEDVECEYPNIMLNLKFDDVSFAKALDDIKKAAERSTMSFKEAANRLYGAPKKVDSEELAKLADHFDRVNAVSPSELRAALNEYEKKETGWISVRDRMPTESGDYLVTDAFTGSVYVYEFGNDCRQDAAYWRAYITHWMPCPKAPVAKKGE